MSATDAVGTVLDRGYPALLRKILTEGTTRTDRTGVGTLEVWAPDPLHYDLSRCTPRLTQRYIPFRPARYEACWILSGSGNARYLEDNGVGIWRSWGDPYTRDLGPVYGPQLRGTGSSGVDQLEYVLRMLETEPTSRRIMWNLWNPADLGYMALPPCHLSCQFRADDEWLDMILYMRSCDVMLGLPADLNLYAIIQTLIARYSGLRPRNLTVMVGSAHVYLNMLEEAIEVLRADTETYPTPLPPPLKVADDAPMHPADVKPEHLSCGKPYRFGLVMNDLYKKVAV